MKKVTYVILILALGLISYFLYSNKDNKNGPAENTQVKYPSQEATNSAFEEIAYIRSIEKHGDGFWYFTLQEADIIQSGEEWLPGNEWKVAIKDTPEQTFKVSPEFRMITDFYCDDRDIGEGLEEYVPKLIRKDNYYWNPKNTSLDHLSGFFYFRIENNILVQGEEVAYFCGA